MALSCRDEAPALDRFSEAYRKLQSEVRCRIEKEVFRVDAGIYGYTTVTQADALADALSLGPGMRLLDIGAFRGWPGLYLAGRTGCRAVLIDLPVAALREALVRSRRQRLEDRCSFLAGTGTALPFRPRVFDAIVHTDVLC